MKPHEAEAFAEIDKRFKEYLEKYPTKDPFIVWQIMFFEVYDCKSAIGIRKAWEERMKLKRKKNK